MKEIDVHELKKKLDDHEDFILIDVREDSEWQDGHIPAAVHVSKGIIERDIEKVVADKSALVILYCGSGYRSELATDAVQKMGYTNVFSLAGGIKAWLSANYWIVR